MFGFGKKKKMELTLIDAISYCPVLDRISKYLKASNNNGQAEYVDKLVELIRKGNITMFIESINTIDMWGGSGAVWEVGIQDRNIAWKFEREIIRLIDLMEKTEILGRKRAILGVRNFFIKNIRLE